MVIMLISPSHKPQNVRIFAVDFTERSNYSLLIKIEFGVRKNDPVIKNTKKWLIKHRLYDIQAKYHFGLSRKYFRFKLKSIETSDDETISSATFTLMKLVFEPGHDYRVSVDGEYAVDENSPVGDW